MCQWGLTRSVQPGLCPTPGQRSALKRLQVGKRSQICVFGLSWSIQRGCPEAEKQAEGLREARLSHPLRRLVAGNVARPGAAVPSALPRGLGQFVSVSSLALSLSFSTLSLPAFSPDPHRNRPASCCFLGLDQECPPVSWLPVLQHKPCSIKTPFLWSFYPK